MKIKSVVFLFYILICSVAINAQIKVYERPTNDTLRDIGLFLDSPTRQKISLNGQWEISFSEGKNFSKFTVPIAYSFDGTASFKKGFSVSEDIIRTSSFIFVAEGISYDCEIKINNNFISKHTGETPVIVELNDGIVSSRNEIHISVSNNLNFKNTIPLSDQINYSKVYGGITKDIYLLAVPKLFVTSNYIKYSVDNLLSVKVINYVDVKSSNLYKYVDTSVVKEFSLQTKIFRKSTASDAGESQIVKFSIGDNNSIKSSNEITVANPVLWTPETPELYTVKTVISNGDIIIDEFITETGFTNLDKKNNQIFLSGREYKLNGINYYEDQPKFASALDYNELENDLRNIKTLGFNAVRVPGRQAHNYIVTICNRLGLFLLEEIPFNELSEKYTDDEKYIRLTLNFISDMVERDRNSPCVFGWGIGNDFDVSKNSSLSYVKAAVRLADSLDKRFTYYTSRAYNVDICSEEVDFIGLNFYEKNYEFVLNSVAEVTNKSKPLSNRKNNSIFISNYGICISNDNSNGYSDIISQEAQMKFLGECFPKISQLAFGNFISSYADWNSENPLNYPLDKNPNLKTSGLYNFNREQKRSADFVKRMLNKEDLPRIMEGDAQPDFPYVFIIIGIVIIVILVYFLNRDKKFRSSVIRCLYKPTYFYTLVKDQMIISNAYNLLLSFAISAGLALFFSVILYYYKADNSFDMILAKIFTNDSSKIVFSEIVNNKFYLLAVLTALNLLLTFLTSLFLYFISFYTKGKSFFKNIYTVCVWSTLPLLLFLFVGTILYKLAENNPYYISLSVWTFLILYLLYLNRIISGAKSLFDIRTGKVYLYGIAIILIIFLSIYGYFFFFSGVTETIDLVSNLSKS